MSEEKPEGKKSWFGRVASWIDKKVDNFLHGSPKWGKTHAGGMARLGLSEIRGALYADSNIAQPTDYGVFGKATPGETADLRRDESPSLDSNQEKKLGPSHPIVEAQPSQETPVAEPKQPEQEVVTSWGSSKLEQCNRELSARQSIEPDHEKDLDR